MTMRNISDESFVATKVLIEFDDGPMSFRIHRGATLGDVSAKLQSICKWHRGGARSIGVRFGALDKTVRAFPQPLISP